MLIVIMTMMFFFIPKSMVPSQHLHLLGAGHKWRHHFWRVSLQTNHVLKIHCILSIHGWSEVKTVDYRWKWWRHLWTALYDKLTSILSSFSLDEWKFQFLFCHSSVIILDMWCQLYQYWHHTGFTNVTVRRLCQFCPRHSDSWYFVATMYNISLFEMKTSQNPCLLFGVSFVRPVDLFGISSWDQLTCLLD